VCFIVTIRTILAKSNMPSEGIQACKVKGGDNKGAGQGKGMEEKGLKVLLQWSMDRQLL